MPGMCLAADRGMKSPRLAELAREIRSQLPHAGELRNVTTGLKIVHRDHTNPGGNCVATASIAVIAAGEKEATMMGRRYRYGAGTCLFLGVDMTDSFRVVGASSERPFLGAALNLEEDVMAAVSARMRDAPAGLLAARQESTFAVSLFEATDGIIDAMTRLAALSREGEAASVLAPIVKEELYCRLWMSPAGAAFRALFHAGSAESRIREAAAWMRRVYREDFDVETAAERIGMSPATFYRRFRDVVGESPRQYVKNLRLFEARRLMIEEGLDASIAAYEVGYESPAYFSREFKRLFGQPPKQYAAAARASEDAA